MSAVRTYRGSASAPTIGLLSPSGWGNLGDAAIQEVTIAALRTRWPGVHIVGFTSNPDDTAQRHGIPAFPLSGYAPPNYSIGGAAHAQIVAPVARVFRRLDDVPLVGTLVRPLRAASEFGYGEIHYWAFAHRWLARMDFLLVSGGGQLDDFWGGTWGHPYTLWRWATLARRTRTPVLVLSVGMGTLRSFLARRFVRGTLRKATYRSYRDERTRTGVTRLLGTPDAGPVIPDLALAFPAASADTAPDAPGIVGISPIAYADPRVWPLKDGVAYRQYVSQLAGVVRGLCESGRRVVLFSTDRPDRLVMEDVWEAAGRPALARRAVTDTLSALLAELAQVRLVVASRLHGVLLSHVAGRPVVALSYDWKVAQHMQDMDQGAHLLSIDAFDTATVRDAIRRLDADWEGARTRVRQRVAESRSLVERQFREVLE